MSSNMTKIAIIGFGEVGGIFASDFVGLTAPDGTEAGMQVAAYDTDPAAQERAKAAGIGVDSPAAACADADIVFVCVTAGSVPAAMKSVATVMHGNPYVVDVNSVSPGAKQQAGRTIEAAGGRYVEAAVMASVPPKRIATPILLGGPHAETFKAEAGPLGMDLTVFSPEIGRASSVKMCRSVMIKGLEALTTECMLAARHYGVEQDVLRTMGDTLPHPDWPGLARYVISRALIHGKRRAEEMREVARTVEDAGVEPLASRAIVERQEWAWRRGAEMGAARNAPDLDTLLDALTESSNRLKAAE